MKVGSWHDFNFPAETGHRQAFFENLQLGVHGMPYRWPQVLQGALMRISVPTKFALGTNYPRTTLDLTGKGVRKCKQPQTPRFF